jgi:hypothetical protein
MSEIHEIPDKPVTAADSLPPQRVPSRNAPGTGDGMEAQSHSRSSPN